MAAEGKKRNIVNVLIRIYYFLKDDELCSKFLKFVHFPEEFSCTSLLPGDTVNSKKIPKEEDHGGFTRKQRYKNTFFHLYFLLEKSIADYCEKFTELEELHNDLCTEIKKFRRNFDLQSILQFLREIDDPDHGRGSILNNQPNNLKNNHRDCSLEILIPHPPDTIMTPIKRIKPLQLARDQLKVIAQRGFSAQQQLS